MTSSPVSEKHSDYSALISAFYAKSLTKFVSEFCSMWASLVAQMAKNPPVNVGDGGSIPGLGRSVGEENGNTLQCSCLENHMDRGAWWTTVLGVTKSLGTTEHTHTYP